LELLALARDRNLLHGGFVLRAAAREQRAERLEIGAAEDGARGLADNGAIEREEPRRRAVDRRHDAGAVHRHHAGRDALAGRLDVAAAVLDFDMFALELERRPLNAPPARRLLARHRVERFDQGSEFVVALRLDTL